MDETKLQASLSSELKGDLKQGKLKRKRRISLSDKENLTSEPAIKTKKRINLSLDSQSILKTFQPNVTPSSSPFKQTKNHLKQLEENNNEIEQAKRKENEALLSESLNLIEASNTSVLKAEFSKEEQSSSLRDSDLSPIRDKSHHQNDSSVVDVNLALDTEHKLDEFKTTVVRVVDDKAPFELSNYDAELIANEAQIMLDIKSEIIKENVGLIKTRRDSLICSTPSKLFDLSETTYRAYHQEETHLQERIERLTQLGSFTSPLVVETPSVEEAKAEISEQVVETTKNEEVLSEKVDEEKKQPGEQTPKADYYDDVVVANFAIKLIKKMFSLDEIKTGIFANKSNSTKSKSQIPFSIEKTNQFKKEIQDHFSFDSELIEYYWSKIRTKLNSKLGEIRRRNKF